ncbi:hypothetical protein [Prevotella koreensis]|uniref:Uncharacterized protein n=1 Tax=Prevotella koreensis TaxID=2490854 RepID=A0A3S0WK63_9BACT|nr:hypothetical protein [Prevotella koreensis]RUL59189.1 hypothetical protein EHV08_05035 [Prevotella koreensis]
MEIFERLKQENLIWDAQIAGKNKFCLAPGEEKCFTDYFSFCLNVATWPVEIETRTFFANEAELALNVFSEKCNMDDSVLTVIQESRSKLVKVSTDINDFILKQTKEQAKSAYDANNKVLANLSKLKSEINQAKGQSQFDEILKKMSTYEDCLDKSILDQQQTTLYNSLTRDFSALVSNKMSEITHHDDIKYNKKAVDSFKKAFELFKANEEKYKKSDTELYGLVSEYLFAFDARRLTNECLVYYNHVYSYIFNKLDDNGKFRFTQFSFDTPKK